MSKDGEYQIHPVKLSEAVALMNEILDICDNQPVPVIEMAAVMVYTTVCGGLRTADIDSQDRRRFYFVMEGLDLLAKLAVTTKHLTETELQQWERLAQSSGRSA